MSVEQTAVDQAETILSDVKIEVKELVDRLEITAEEKFKVRDLEADFLKAQAEMRNLQDRYNKLQEIVTKTQSEFPTFVANIAKRLEISLDDYVFNAVELVFTKKPKQ